MLWTLREAKWRFFTLMVVSLLTMGGVGAIQWIGIYHLRKSSDYPREATAPAFTPRECEIARFHLGFKPRQARFCNHPRNGFSMLPVLRAARAVGYHCPDTFSDRRWNCSSIENLPRMSPELTKGTREQAIVHAYAAAALVFEIGRYCALNKIRYCSCGMASATEMIVSPDGNQMSRLPQEVLSTSRRIRRQLDASSLRQMTDSISFNPGGNEQSGQIQGNYQWSGCADNVETARSYVAQFLGFDEKLLLMGGYQPITRNAPPVYDSGYNNPAEPIIPGSEADSQPFGFYSPPTSSRPPRFLSRKTRSTKVEAEEREGSQTETNHQRVVRAVGQKRKNPSKMKLSNMHNYMAGTWMMIALQKPTCKCHGLSGACTQKVCFRQLQRIDTEPIKAAIRQRYLTSKMVSGVSNGRLMASVFKDTGFVDEYVGLDDLVFTQHSPDYCEPEPQRGSLGTHGRSCSVNSTGAGSCLNMCCGRGHQTMTQQIYEKCNCIMQPNFKVHCQTCVRKEERHNCD